MYAIPFSAAIISFFILGESIHMIQMIGGIIMLLGISVVKIKVKETLPSDGK
jgi:drug/metabolite transporter (DMT)-like permease